MDNNRDQKTVCEPIQIEIIEIAVDDIITESGNEKYPDDKDDI